MYTKIYIKVITHIIWEAKFAVYGAIKRLEILQKVDVTGLSFKTDWRENAFPFKT
jgi:hypothetical protein